MILLTKQLDDHWLAAIDGDFGEIEAWLPINGVGYVQRMATDSVKYATKIG